MGGLRFRFSRQEMVEFYRQGWSQSKLAEYYGVRPEVIGYWLRKLLPQDEHQRLAREHTFTVGSVIVACSTCGRQFEKPHCRVWERNYCSRRCFNLSKRQADRERVVALYLAGETTGTIPAIVGTTRSTVARILAKELPDETLRKRITENHMKAVRASVASGYHGPRGPEHPWWKGGITDPKKRARTCAEYDAWRKGVFERDNYTCQKCGLRGGRLNAHHIKPVWQYPDLELGESNGVTLCLECHRQEHRRGNHFSEHAKAIRDEKGRIVRWEWEESPNAIGQ